MLTGERRVSAEAVEHVTQAAAQLAYVHKPAARAMATSNGTRIVIGVGSPRPTLVVDEYLSRVASTAARLCATERIGVEVQPLSVTVGALDVGERYRFGQLVRDVGESLMPPRAISSVLLISQSAKRNEATD